MCEREKDNGHKLTAWISVCLMVSLRIGIACKSSIDFDAVSSALENNKNVWRF